ncbi:MAG: phosphoribosyltransferase [Pseudanabaenaceae cyanobacterium bins.68]|nr:phosphoribosyltransferase [Pseudanabaenaceae cyanobacterium bins.68]
MKKLPVTWPEYHRKIEQLALQIYESDWQFEQILCLARGGLRVGDILSRIFDRPLAVLCVSSYDHSGNRGQLKFSATVSMTSAYLAGRLLVVDDLVDSGETLVKTLAWLKNSQPAIPQLRTAVIWYKACSQIAPDYYVEYLADNPWIVQPFEVYENFKFE